MTFEHGFPGDCTHVQCMILIATLFCQDSEVEKKERLQDEMEFIEHHFKQRICKNYCRRSYSFREKLVSVLKERNISIRDTKL